MKHPERKWLTLILIIIYASALVVPVQAHVAPDAGATPANAGATPTPIWQRVWDKITHLTTGGDTHLSATTFVSPLPMTFVSPLTLVPYQDPDAQVKEVTPGAEEGFQDPLYNPAGFLNRPAGFGLTSSYCPINTSQNVNTTWNADSDILLRRELNLPPDLANVEIGVAIDDAVQFFVNGQDVSGGVRTNPFCAINDYFIFDVPNHLLNNGANLIAMRGQNYGLSYLDMQVKADKATAIIAKGGYDNIQINWSPAPSPYVDHYRLWRAVQGTETYAVIANTSETTYFDGVGSGTFRGKTYCYFVEAVDNAQTPLYRSGVACANMGEVRLWVQSGRGPEGGTVTIAVNVRNAQSLKASSYGIWVVFDNRVLELIDVAPTALTAGFLWDWNVIPEGHLDRAMISAAATGNEDGLPELYDDGSLFQLTFNVKGQPQWASALDMLDFVSGVGGSAIWAYPGWDTIPLALEDGTFHTDGAFLRGDVDGNGVVELADAELVLDFADHKGTPTSTQLNAGDINGNGILDPGDAYLIRFYADNGYWPTAGAYMLQATHSSMSGPLQFSVKDTRGLPGQAVHIYVRGEDLREWVSGSFSLAYDPDVIADIVAVEAVGPAAKALLDYNSATPGIVRIAMTQQTEVTGGGVILDITARLRRSAPSGAEVPIALAEVQLNNRDGLDLANSALQRTIERVPGALSIDYALFLPMIIR